MCIRDRHYVPPLHHCPVDTCIGGHASEDAATIFEQQPSSLKIPQKEWMQRVLAFTAHNSSTSSNALAYMVGDTEAVTPRKAQEGKYHTMWLATMSRMWNAGENNVSGYEYIGVRSAPSVSTVRDVGNSSDRDCLPYRCMHPTGYRHALLTCDSPIG